MRDYVKPKTPAESRATGAGRGAATIAIAMLLAGCVAERPLAPPGPFGQYINSMPRKTARPVSRPLNQAKAAPEAASTEAVTTPEQQPVEQPMPEPEPAQPSSQIASAVPSSNDLVGLDPQHARELLGPAAQTNNQSPATVWHYKSGRCELDLAFYMEMRSGQMHALHYNFKGEGDSPEQRQACLRSIIEENRKSERS